MFAAISPQRWSRAFLPGVVLLLGCPRPAFDFGGNGEPKSPADLLARVRVAQGQVTSISGDAKLWVDSPQGKGAVTLFVSTALPALLHFEQLDFFGRPESALLTDGERFGLFLSSEGAYYQGPASPANLGRFLPVVLPPRELVMLLLGRPPLISDEATTMRFDETSGVYVLELTRESYRQRLEVKPPSYRVVKSEAVGVEAAYTVGYGELTELSGVNVAKRLELRAPSAKTSLELTWKDITVNQAPDLTMFELTPPDGARVVNVDEQGLEQP